MPWLDREICPGFLVVEDMGFLGGLAKVLDRNLVEIGEEGLARFADARLDDLFEQFRPRTDVVGISGAEADRRAHDFADGDPASFASEFVSTSRPAHTLEYLGVDQPLKKRLQMPWRKLMPSGERLGRDGRGA